MKRFNFIYHRNRFFFIAAKQRRNLFASLKIQKKSLIGTLFEMYVSAVRIQALDM